MIKISRDDIEEITADPLTLFREVSPNVVALANTQMAFRCSGADPWITKKFGREYIQEINDLPVGTCRIKVNISTPDQEPINARIYLPNVGSEPLN